MRGTRRKQLWLYGITLCIGLLVLACQDNSSTDKKKRTKVPPPEQGETKDRKTESYLNLPDPAPADLLQDKQSIFWQKTWFWRHNQSKIPSFFFIFARRRRAKNLHLFTFWKGKVGFCKVPWWEKMCQQESIPGSLVAGPNGEKFKKVLFQKAKAVSLSWNCSYVGSLSTKYLLVTGSGCSIATNLEKKLSPILALV